MSPLPSYLAALAGFSLIAIGGANAVLPELRDVTVRQHHWLASADFQQAFAIAQAAPGPNVLVVAVVGFKLGGVAGGIASVVAMCGPSSLLAYAVARLWTRLEGSRTRAVLAATLAPIAAGLVTGSGILVARASLPAAAGIAVVALATLAALRTRLSPLAILALGAVAGVAGAR